MFKLTIQLVDDWYSGTGQSSNGTLNQVTQKTTTGLPCIPTTQLKGQLLRESISLAEAYGWLDTYCDLVDVSNGPAYSFTELLCGSEQIAGFLELTPAVLSANEAELFTQNPSIKDYLYKTNTSSSRNEKGAAKNKHLRSIQVCIPCQLESSVTVKYSTENDALYKQQQQLMSQANALFTILKDSFTLIPMLGGGRHDGYGEHTIELSINKGKPQ